MTEREAAFRLLLMFKSQDQERNTHMATISRNELMAYLTNLLSPHEFKDYCENGLQVEGSDRISTIVSGVTACQALLDKAVELGADAVLVHHGYFWKGEPQSLVGMKGRRIRTLIKNDINLIGYHLPLDAHAEFGNNAQLAKLLGVEITGGLEAGNPNSIGLVGQLETAVTPDELSERLEKALNRKPLHISGGPLQISRIAWCTGSADSYIGKALAAEADAYITGEISEPVVHTAREEGIHFYSAGHHATERYGVKSLGEHLASHFDLEHHFVDIDNPV
ncbi:Nif3-like dinuclear metal center hexameric protein [Litoribacillus peritrichatus]